MRHLLPLHPASHLPLPLAAALLQPLHCRILTIQSFECLNVSAQVLCSSYLGAGDTATARGILLRLLSLGTLIGVVAGVALFLSRDLVAHFFTADPAVIIQVCTLCAPSHAPILLRGLAFLACHLGYAPVTEVQHWGHGGRQDTPPSTA